MAKHTVLSSGAKLWRSLACAKSELRLDLTLACGQSFRWRETAEGHWTGVIRGRVWTLTQTDDTLWYHMYQSLDRFKEAVKKEEEEPVAVTPVHQDTKEEEEMQRDYFQLNVKLGDLYKEWGAADHHFKHIADIFTGIRMLRQDPTECLFSFMCTSNNHITRIQGMVERLCQSLGAPLCQLDQTSYHNFPSLSALADTSVEARLRDLSFGAPYLQARDALRTLPGVGTKVADCVCLMSLDKVEAVPIDTHVWQIAKRDYKYGSGNGQTGKLHRDIGDFFRKLWGPYAGWAQSVLFCADLKKVRNLKEMLHMKRPKKEENDEEENDEEELTVAGKKRKI
ncbi:hypothetical protein CgunFtcFv8_000829 [Champsocephalus gunnari]|uniref:N-glycosylase/DNA lyase n=1 Tax=Champsocephalus gunnari TaxID=52237 RepID=A0AAN8HPT6_CHAGU|nr:hypothetical protein CgunFtcFv8_000829 [Champsocephalus gunnari]